VDAFPPRFLADADIPLAQEALSRYGPVRVLSGRAIDRAACRHADALIVRSVSRVDASTLSDTPVRFVGTATAGVDHVDVDYLTRREIRFAFAPGSNAESVVEWVIASLLAMGGGIIRGRVVGVVGVGHVGGALVPRLRALGARVLPCDPPLADAAEAGRQPHEFVSYADVLEEADVITFHTPLTFDGPHPTFHLLGMEELRATRPGVWVLNSSRGAVVDGEALEASIRSGHVVGAAVDVWENEPTPESTLIEVVDIATPHIAGYSYDAKVAGAAMMEEAVRAWLVDEGLALPPAFDWVAASPEADLVLDAPPADDPARLDLLVRGAYDIRADDARFRSAMLDPARDRRERGNAFAELRRLYPTRRSWRFHRVRGDLPTAFADEIKSGLRMAPVG
jgi:erythronate-4-phosphate dehydrogenase